MRAKTQKRERLRMERANPVDLPEKLHINTYYFPKLKLYSATIGSEKFHFALFQNTNTVEILDSIGQVIGSITSAVRGPVDFAANERREIWDREHRGKGLGSAALKLLENAIFEKNGEATTLSGGTVKKSVLLMFLRNGYELSDADAGLLCQHLSVTLRKPVARDGIASALKDRHVLESLPARIGFSKTIVRPNDLFWGE
ncbi:MAG: hypothetical protein HY394_06265 [Candidatus Diapherotrites archaeon]|nr:hypothetical protein [Candidatus Diapherotrites archaeon]